MKDKVIKVLADYKHGAYIGTIYEGCGVNPHVEDDRPKVWAVGQALAELSYSGFIRVDYVKGERFAVKV